LKKLAITHPAVERYLQAMTPTRDRTLREMEALARREAFPIIGPQVGRLLAQLIILRRPHVIVELGSGFGYSAYWMARAAGPEMVIHCSEHREHHADRLLRFFRRAGLEDRVECFVGNALDLLRSFNDGSVDFLLNDVDKTSYPDVLNLATRKMRSGGLFVTDNVLWSGRVLAGGTADAATRAIRRFNRELIASRRFLTSIIPLRDGLALAVRK
jgi:predicted O-methyltransferase YrrM